MAHSLSAKKRIRQNEKRRVVNRQRTSEVKTETKKFLSLVQQREVAGAQEQLKLVHKKLDQVAAKGTMHANTAARTKSRLAKRLGALEQAVGAAGAG